MLKPLTLLLIIALAGCTAQKQTTSSKSSSGAGDTRTVPVEFIDDYTFLLSEITYDVSYGYTETNPINVGGIHDGDAVLNEQRFLNALLGPNGEDVTYSRAGSCCAFPTPNGLIGDAGMLDIYIVQYEGSAQSVKLYINMYDKGNLKIPVGFTAKQKK